MLTHEVTWVHQLKILSAKLRSSEVLLRLNGGASQAASESASDSFASGAGRFADALMLRPPIHALPDAVSSSACPAVSNHLFS